MSSTHSLQVKDQDNGSTPAATQKPVGCEACFGEQDLVSLPCGHSWCKDCISRACAQVRVESDWPLRCNDECNVPEDLALQALPQEEARSLRPKLEEFNTPPQLRCWCANRECGAFIPPAVAEADDRARCQQCDTTTCRLCSDKAHDGECTGPSEEEQQAFNLMSKKGYQQCSRCHRMTERTVGCPHMTCPCGYEFCYHCGGQIKLCNGCVHLEAENILTLPEVDEVDGIDNTLTAQLQQAFRVMFLSGLPNHPQGMTNQLNARLVDLGYVGPPVYMSADGSTYTPFFNMIGRPDVLEMSDVALWSRFIMGASEPSASEDEDEVDGQAWDSDEEWSM